MDFINNIVKESIIICNDSDKTKILKRNKLINLKVMNIQEFIFKYCFNYDENTILYIMNKYNIKYEIALVYLKNLYYIDNQVYNVEKLDFLVNLKKELDEQNLLIYNNLFKEYVKNIDIYIYGIKLSKYELNVLKDLNYKYIEKKQNKYNHKIYSFNTIEEEIEYIAISICNLIENGINIKNIKLTNVDSSYYNTITRIFQLFGLKVNLTYSSPLISYPYIRNFISMYNNNNLEYAISNLDSKNELYDKIIDIINKYKKYNSKELLIYKLEHTNIYSNKYDNGIEVIDFLDNSTSPEDYVFMIGFNDGLIPKSYKDIDYITDNIKTSLPLDTTKEKNIQLRKNILESIYNIKNLVITYKLKDTKKTFYPSSMCTYFEVIEGKIDQSISYSEKYNKIKLTRSIDNYIKYGQKDKNFDLLYHNFNVPYNSFNNKYSLINRVMDKLTLSYSKMQEYNKCAFRYYLNNILRIDIFENNFATILGSMVHYAMEKCLSNNDMDIEKYVDEFLSDKTLNNKEKFFIEKYKKRIKELLEQTILEKEYSSFDKALYEKEINIDYGNNIKFTGIIDKVLYKEENNQSYVALVDYKTGNDEISLKYLEYGLNIQLPIYLYLSDYMNLRNIVYSGFYLQKFNIKDRDYRLEGYSNSDKNTLSIIDNNYENSKIIKGMKTNKDGNFSKHSKILSNEDIDKIKEITKDKINEVIENIKNNKFDINPKIDEKNNNIGCNFCKFKDICFVTKKDKIKIISKEFGDDDNGLD